MKFEDNNRSKVKNDCGVALVSVLIVITLIGLLASSILNLSYLAYERKLVEKKNNDNFYDAEAVIDTVKASLQNTAASALSTASSGTDAFAEAAFKLVTNEEATAVGTTASEAAKQQVRDALYSEVCSMGVSVAAAISGSDVVVGTDTDGNDIYGNDGTFEILGNIVVEADCLRIEKVHVIYINNEGYQAEITTDITINAPVYASDEEVPIGTYSMFAGSGGAVISNAEINTGHDLNNVRYNAQQGNVYFGAMIDDNSVQTSTSFTLGSLDNPKLGMSSIFSVGGTNAVFNGDVILYPGSTLIFEGGDGDEACNIQVNGYIYLGAGATLLLPSNVNLVCKGIKVVSSFNSDGTVATSTNYIETKHATVSEFYPLKKGYITEQYEKIYKNKYLYNKIGIADLLLETGALSDTAASNVDTRFTDIRNEISGNTTSVAAGVYMLSTEYTLGTGWTRSNSDMYYALECSGGIWSCEGKSGLYNGNITCSENDAKLEQKELVYYDGNYYDAEFWDFINVPVLSLTSQDSKISKCLKDYISSANASTTNNTYEKVKFSELATYYSEKRSSWTYIENYLWENITTGENSYDISSRKLIIPNNDEDTETVDWSNYTVEYDGKTYSARSDKLQVSAIAQTVDAGDCSIAFCVNLEDFAVQVNEGCYVGLFLTAGKVTFTAGTGTTIGMSLLEMGKKLTSNGLEDSSNEMRIFLEKLATCITTTGNIVQKYQNANTDGKNGNANEFLLVDNIFNGGISALWDTTSSVTDSSASSAADNSSINFVDTENWSKD